jgi:hypothetical protein
MCKNPRGKLFRKWSTFMVGFPHLCERFQEGIPD